jgi:Icc-related predicted phosphoesterase
MTKIVLVSDTHCITHPMSMDKMPEADLLIHAGDLCLRGSVDELDEATAWLSSLRDRYDQIICVAGNHDWPLVREPDFAQRMMRDRGITYLQDSGLTYKGLHFWGSPWTPTFFNWAFMLPRSGSEIAEKWKMIPDNTDVLITHGPPYGILDPGLQADNVGCEALARELTYRLQPQVHVFGHLHEGHGIRKPHGPDDLQTTFVNASLLNDSYRPVYQPIVVEI